MLVAPETAIPQSVVPPQTVIPAKAGISGEGAGQEPHEIPTFVGMTA